MRRMPSHFDEPCYIISVAARMVDLHPQTLRHYESVGLIRPVRVSGRRMYSPRDVERLAKIVRLTDELGVNLAGVEVILNMTEKIRQMREEMQHMETELERLRLQIVED